MEEWQNTPCGYMQLDRKKANYNNKRDKNNNITRKKTRYRKGILGLQPDKKATEALANNSTNEYNHHPS